MGPAGRGGRRSFDERGLPDVAGVDGRSPSTRLLGAVPAARWLAHAAGRGPGGRGRDRGPGRGPRGRRRQGGASQRDGVLETLRDAGLGKPRRTVRRDAERPAHGGGRYHCRGTDVMAVQVFRGHRNPQGLEGDWAVTEFEPVVDAADFMRFGENIACQRSHVTNQFGIDWLRRSLGDGFTVSCIQTNDPHAMHIDATIAPLAPGKLLVNPLPYVPSELFDDWEILPAPPPTLPADWPMYFCTPWVSMNVLSLSPDTVVVERHEQPLIDVLTSWGFRCLPVDFRHVYSFGGSFHCVTLDVRRAGSSGKYLNSPTGRP